MRLYLVIEVPREQHFGRGLQRSRLLRDLRGKYESQQPQVFGMALPMKPHKAYDVMDIKSLSSAAHMA